MPTPELLHFSVSHFNEKGRWALDWKGVPHVRTALLPGPHKLRVQRVSGQGRVPVLRDGETVVVGSSQIIAHLEATTPTPPLYPPEPDACRRALDIQRWFDDEIGPAVRLALFHELFEGDLGWFAAMFTNGRGLGTRLAYRAAIPGIRRVVASEYAITAETARVARDKTREGLDFVAREAGPDGYLVGDRFSVADLAAAALLAPAVDFHGGHPFPYPTPISPVVLRFWEAWTAHPGAEWVRRTYARHRGTSAAIAG
jgi:glutathione S-transferase